MSFLSRNGAIALAITWVVFGLWLGEGATPIWQALPLAGGAIGGLVVALVLPGRVHVKVLAGIASLVVYAAAFSIGSQSFGRAFEECMAKGEGIRVLLSEYHDKKSTYPESLDQVLEESICDRMLRPTILKYQRTNGGYHLSFGDWFVEHTATEAEPFMARK